MTGNGTVFGRSPNLVVGALSALYGVVSIFHVGGFTPTADQTNYVIIAIGALVGLIANTGSISIAAGQAAADRATSTVASVITEPTVVTPATATPPPTIVPVTPPKPVTPGKP